MKSIRGTGIVIGALFLFAMGVYMAGSGLVDAGLDRANGFAGINAESIRLGAILEFFNSAAVVGIAALLLPILKRTSEWIAHAYLASRLTEAVLLLACTACALAAPIADGTNALLGLRDQLFQLAMASLGLGSVLFCGALYAGRLVPRALSVLGVAGYVCLAVGAWLNIFGVPSTLLLVPGAAFEILFPLWLFVKGLKVVPEGT